MLYTLCWLKIKPLCIDFHSNLREYFLPYSIVLDRSVNIITALCIRCTISQDFHPGV